MTESLIVWCPPKPVVGPAPVGEVETWCPSCSRRFISGERAVVALIGMFRWPVLTHVGLCALQLEARYLSAFDQGETP